MDQLEWMFPSMATDPRKNEETGIDCIGAYPMAIQLSSSFAANL